MKHLVTANRLETIIKITPLVECLSYAVIQTGGGGGIYIFVHQPNLAGKVTNLSAPPIFFQPGYSAGKNVLIFK